MLKFRAWDKVNNRMIEVNEINFNYRTIGQYEGDLNFLKKYKYDDVVSIQYTDIKDKKGEQICEGDILKINDWTYGYVIQETGCWMMKYFRSATQERVGTCL